MPYGLFEILHGDREFLLSRNLLQLLFHRFQFRRESVGLEFGTRARFVDQIDRFVRKEPVGDVPIRQLHGLNNGVFRDFHSMMLFVSVPKPLDNADRFVEIGRLNVDRLESPFQGTVFFNMLSVLIQGRSPNALDLAAR